MQIIITYFVEMTCVILVEKLMLFLGSDGFYCKKRHYEQVSKD